jgi:hypothetical protein
MIQREDRKKREWETKKEDSTEAEEFPLSEALLSNANEGTTEWKIGNVLTVVRSSSVYAFQQQ